MGKIIQNGVIYTGTGSGGGSGASSVDQLTDVQLTNPTTGDELVYNSNLTSPYKWENKKLSWTGTQAQYDAIVTKDPDVTYFITDSDAGNYGITDLADVNITSAANGQLLTYDSANSVWVNKKSNNLPIAYIKFTGTDAASSWSETATVYNTVTITDEYGNTLTPSNLRDNTTKELLYGIRVEYERLDSSDNVIGHFIFGDVSAQYNDFIDNYYFIGNMNYSWFRYQVNFAYNGSPERYIASCYEIPITYQSLTAASGGTDLSLVTTGEKYTWNNPVASNIEYASGVTVKQAIDSKIQIATFSFSKAINATTQTTYGLARTDFNLPNNAVAVSVFLREYVANSVNAGGLVYSAYVNPTSSTVVEGAIYNGTNTSRTYYITATLFYTT